MQSSVVQPVDVLGDRDLEVDVLPRALKNWQGLVTRYDKHALVDRAGLVLAAILL